MNRISFNVNNGGYLNLSQEMHDGPVTISGTFKSTAIPAKDMVQLANLYRYTKRYDIRDSFINPHGRREFIDGALAITAAADPVEPPLPIWFFLFQDGDAGYHVYRRPVDEHNPDPALREDINDIVSTLSKQFVSKHGGGFLACWVQTQLVECLDLADIPLDIPD